MVRCCSGRWALVLVIGEGFSLFSTTEPGSQANKAAAAQQRAEAAADAGQRAERSHSPGCAGTIELRAQRRVARANHQRRSCRTRSAAFQSGCDRGKPTALRRSCCSVVHEEWYSAARACRRWGRDACINLAVDRDRPNQRGTIAPDDSVASHLRRTLADRAVAQSSRARDPRTCAGARPRHPNQTVLSRANSNFARRAAPARGPPRRRAQDLIRRESGCADSCSNTHPSSDRSDTRRGVSAVRRRTASPRLQDLIVVVGRVLGGSPSAFGCLRAIGRRHQWRTGDGGPPACLTWFCRSNRSHRSALEPLARALPHAERPATGEEPTIGLCVVARQSPLAQARVRFVAEGQFRHTRRLGQIAACLSRAASAGSRAPCRDRGAAAKECAARFLIDLMTRQGADDRRSESRADGTLGPPRRCDPRSAFWVAIINATRGHA